MWACSCPWQPPHGVLDASCPCPGNTASSCAPWWAEPQPKSPLCSPNGLYPKPWETNTALLEGKWGPRLRLKARPSAKAPRIGFPRRRLERCWLSLLWRGSPKLGLPAGCPYTTPVFSLLLLFPHPFSHQSSYLWGGQGPPPGKDKKSLQLYLPSSISFIK